MNITVDDAIAAVVEVLRNKGCSAARVDADVSLVELELDSLDLAETLILLEERAGGELNPASIDRLETVRDIARLSVSQ